MKFWHWVVGPFIDNSAAWLVSLALLVLTVRGLIAPLNWFSVRSGRVGALIRPEQTRLREARQKSEDPEEIAELMLKEQALQKQYNFNPALGCLPPLIMMPFFLGLYQVVLRMARYGDDIASIGVLNRADIESFQATQINGVSISALARDHQELVTPVLALAILFTILNLLISLYRTYVTLQFDQKIGRRTFWFMCAMLFFVPWLLWNAATVGPVPVAVIFYWGGTYLFTLVQTLVCEVLLRRRYPLTEDVRQFHREGIARWRDKAGKREEKARKRAEKKERRNESPEAKAERKEKHAARMEIEKQARAIVRERRATEKRPSISSDGAAEDADSN